MSRCIDRPDLAFGNLGRISTGLLGILEPYSRNNKIPLESKDYDNINDIKKFLGYAIRGWENRTKSFFKYDHSFFATPSFASRVSLETIGYYIGYVKDIKEVRNKLRNYLAVLDRFQNEEEINKKELNETIKFLDGLSRISDEEVKESIFGIKSPRKTLFPRSLIDYIRPQSPLHPKDVNPKNTKQVKKCFKEQIAYAEMLESSSHSPFTHPLVQRTHREP